MCDIKNISKADKCCICKITFAVCFIVSLSLIIGGFLMPPMGVINGSVVTASATARRKGIDNTPDAQAKANLTALVANVLDPLREKWGAPKRRRFVRACSRPTRQTATYTQTTPVTNGKALLLRTL